MKLTPGEEIVQSWRASDWPEGITSQVKYHFHAKKNGCEIAFEHKDIPPEFEKDIENGWHDFYWEPLKNTSVNFIADFIIRFQLHTLRVIDSPFYVYILRITSNELYIGQIKAVREQKKNKYCI